MSASTLRKMTRLHLSRPAVNAPAVVVAAWYERKATLTEHLAAAGTAGARGLALDAHRHAARVLSVPGPAAVSAKNTTTGPGLPTPSDDDSRRLLMVGAPPVLTTHCVSAVAGGGGR